MIAVINVEITAANPSMPLFPWRAYANSPSSLRIRNVPRRVGNWNIDKVYVSAAYPDNSIKSAECVLVGGIWVCTIAGSTSTGFSQNGYTIFADGKDENGNEVTGYILGKGDITILEADGTITPGETTYYVHMLSAEPSTPKDGDLWNDDGTWYIYQDGTSYPIGDDSGLIQQLSARVDGVETLLSAKQDKLSDSQISAIDSVVDERQTVITFTDNTISAFDWSGTITKYTMIDAGLFDGDEDVWIKSPVSVKIGTTVTAIGEYAFGFAYNLSSVTIPDSVTSIGDFAFYNCANLTSVTIGNSVTSIGHYAFQGCSSLPEITVPKSIRSIGVDAFAGTSTSFKLYLEEQIPSALPYTTNYPWGVANTANIITVRNATKEWVEEQAYGKGFLWRDAIVNARKKCDLQPFYVNALTLAAARATFEITMTITSTTARESYFALTLGNFTQPMTWDTPFDVFEGGSAAAIAPKPNTMNIYHIFEYTSGHFMVEKFNGTYEELENYALKSELPTSADYVALVPNSKDNVKNAVTIGTRKTNSYIGERSFVFGAGCEASGPDTLAFGWQTSAVGQWGANFSIGENNICEGECSFALGSYAAASDDFAFTWNHTYSGTKYPSHGEGTFNINPKDGLSGFYIGNTSLASIIGDIETLINAI